jgi:hypothetical protein
MNEKNERASDDDTTLWFIKVLMDAKEMCLDF